MKYIMIVYSAVSILLIVLKLFGVINWPWVIVTAPYWIALLVLALLVAINYVKRFFIHRDRFF